MVEYDDLHGKIVKGSSKQFLKNLLGYYDSLIESKINTLIDHPPVDSNELHQEMGFIKGLKSSKEYFEGLMNEKSDKYE